MVVPQSSLVYGHQPAGLFTALWKNNLPCMAPNFRMPDTGLKKAIYVSVKLGVQHGPRVKVATKYGERLSNSGEFVGRVCGLCCVAFA